MRELGRRSSSLRSEGNGIPGPSFSFTRVSRHVPKHGCLPFTSCIVVPSLILNYNSWLEESRIREGGAIYLIFDRSWMVLHLVDPCAQPEIIGNPFASPSLRSLYHQFIYSHPQPPLQSCHCTVPRLISYLRDGPSLQSKICSDS